MTLDAIADVQARIASIQSRFAPAPPQAVGTSAQAVGTSAQANGASTQAGGASTSATSFADVLAALQNPSTTDPLSSSLDGAGSLDGSGDGSSGAANPLAGIDPSALAGIDPSALGGLASSGASSLGNASAPNFVATALAEAGKRYVYGAQASPSDPNPAAFDCSELVQWAAARNGVALPRTAGQQYATLAAHGDAMPVDQALRTPGALLFEFSSPPTVGGAEPAHAHVAISLGDGRTIEARGRNYGVGVFDAGHRFAYAATVPGLS